MPTVEELASADPDDTSAPTAADLIERPAAWTPAEAEKASAAFLQTMRDVKRWRAERAFDARDILNGRTP